MAGVPELDMVRLRRWAEEKIPAHVRDEIRLEVGVRGKYVTIFETRPPWRPDLGSDWTRHKVAQLRYDPGQQRWTLHWADRNGRWDLYWDAEPSNSVVPLLEEIDNDPTGIFWG